MKHFLDSPDWTVEELARLYQARTNFIPYEVIALQLNRTAEDCEAKWNAPDNWKESLGFETGLYSDLKEQEKSEQIKKLSDRIDNRLHLNRIRTDVLIDRMTEILVPYNKVPPPTPYKPSKKKKDRGEPEEVGLMLSDAHIGQKHTLEETGGLGEYSMDTFEKRMKNLCKGVRDIYEKHSTLYDLPILNIFMLGDNTHGMAGVGKWSPAYIEASIIDQVFEGARVIADAVYYFLTIFKEVHIFGVGGNHGRAAEKGAEKDYVNWDYIIYKYLMAMFRNEPRVKITAPKTYFVFTMIKNHKFLLLHGEDVKGGNSPIASLSRSEAKLTGVLRDFPDYTMIGHFHSAAEQSTNHGELLINGSFIGVDMHSLKALQVGGRPVQKLFGIHEKHGLTWRYNIDLNIERED